MQNNLDILTRAAERWMRDDRAVTKALDAHSLEQTLDLKLDQQGCDAEQLELAIFDYLDYSPQVTHGEFYKLLYSGLNKEALLGDWITSLSNATMHTYQVGPVATLMELELIRQWNKLVGFTANEGVMVAGGSQANLIGMMLARHRACPNYKTEGIAATNGKPLRAYISDQAHYSNQRAANLLGIGTQNLLAVASDDQGRICTEALEQAIEQDLRQGFQPFYLGLTAGTTVIGAFDKIAKCSEVAKRHDIWLHIDGAWGAPVLFSEHNKHLLEDSHLADSFAWDAHKLMNVPITAAVILVNHPNALKECVAGGGGEYLFHQDANSDYNLGERSIQCGRRADALKVWLSWKALGNQGFANKVDYLQALKQHCVNMIEQQDKLQMLAPAKYLNVLFRYVPESTSDENVIAKLNINICERLKSDGLAYVDYARYKGRTGIRLILANDQVDKEDLNTLLNHCTRIGEKLDRDTRA